MSKYEPELGQAVFGQPPQEYDCPEWIEALLWYIDKELDRVMWNVNQEEYASPFANTGNSYKNDTFEVHAYSWDDEEQPYNFKYEDIEISWYKYLGRGMSINKITSEGRMIRMLEDCLESIRKEDKDIFNLLGERGNEEYGKNETTKNK